jgi:hypothetical protein
MFCDLAVVVVAHCSLLFLRRVCVPVVLWCLCACAALRRSPRSAVLCRVFLWCCGCALLFVVPVACVLVRFNSAHCCDARCCVSPRRAKVEPRKNACRGNGKEQRATATPQERMPNRSTARTTKSTARPQIRARSCVCTNLICISARHPICNRKCSGVIRNCGPNWSWYMIVAL